MTYRLSLDFDRTTGRFHHYQVWLSNGRSAFVAHVMDLIPATTKDQAYAFISNLNQGLGAQAPATPGTELMDFSEYVAEINRLARRAGALRENETSYCAAEAWRDAFLDGLTPAEAWNEEMAEDGSD